ncbi:MAG TPA: hypothetical protein VN799_02675, partial [Acidimicrobiales bacterium]|nr:hypothetical protein [Acidimicrobiales bacterium]
MTAIDDPSAPAPADVDDADPTAARLDAAAAMRQLGHAIVGHDVDDTTLHHLTATVQELLDRVRAAPPRQPPRLDMNGGLFAVPPPQGGTRGTHFPDCIVT